MKLYYLLLLIFFQIQAFGQSIPLEKVFDNNQNDSSNSLSLKKKGTWYNVYNLNFDLPENVQSAKYVHGIIDYDQVVFQSCKSLNDTIWNDVRLTYSINRWGIDTVGCSSKKINSFINGVVLRFNDDENLYYAIDQNNNYDFRDETFYQVNKSINRLHNIKFERFELDQLIKDSVQIKITDVRFKDDEVVRLNFNYCESRKAIYELNGQNVVFEIKADDWYSYHKESEISIKIDGEKKQVVSINQYFKVGDYFFRIESINKQGTLLNLKSVDWNGYPKSNQIGFQAPEIFYNGVNMLDKYKGKYIYLYFWNIDCGACEKGLPKKNKYFNSKKDLFDEKLIPLLISVGKPEQHKRFLKEHNIDWKNIETIGNSELFDLYGISGYPTQYLISPQGEIIEKGNLRIELEKYFINKNDEK